MLPKLAKELSGDLIKVASGHVSEEEFFSNAPNEVAEAALTMPAGRGRSIRSSGAVFHPLRYDAAKVLKQKRFIHEVVHARLQACVAI